MSFVERINANININTIRTSLTLFFLFFFYRGDSPKMVTHALKNFARLYRWHNY